MIEVISFEKTLKGGVLDNSIPNKKTTKFWIDLINPTKDELKKIQQVFKLHKTTTDDLGISRTRPKIEQFDSYNVIILYDLITENNIIKGDQIGFILGKNYLITCSHTKTIINHFKKEKDKISELLKQGPDYLLHGIIESIVNNYFPQLESIDNELDKLQNLALTNPNPKVLERLMSVKREIQKLRKALLPQREIILNLSIGKFQFISDGVKIYFRDTYDHMIIITDLIEDYRETTTSIMEVNLSVITNKTNEVIKVLTIIATVLMPLTLITSIYGMNFKYMPELNWKYGYFIVLGVMLLVLIIIIIFLKRKKWI